MRLTPSLALLALLLTGCSHNPTWQKWQSDWNARFHPQTPLPPSPPREFRAAWVATVANIDWPSKPGLPVSQQIAEINTILDRAKEMNLNAIILQVRTSADAFYASPYEPWSEYLTGRQGLAPSPYYDPLSTWVQESHRRGIELHAWFNPYRARHSGAKTPDAESHVANTNPDIVKKFNKWEWLDPGEPAAARRTLDVILDVVRRYDIDGVHLDDYFYPYPDYYTDPATKTKTVQDFPDDPSFQRYQQGGGTLARGDWRRDNVNRLMHAIYAGIKAERPRVKFGISPFGIARPGVPESVKSKFDQYNTLYADTELWLKNGWCDYWTPQIYWKLESDQPYADLLRWWADQNLQHRHLWPGNYVSSVGIGDKKWPASEIVNQIEATRQTPTATGNVHFSMVAFLDNRGGLTDALKNGPYRDPALAPASPWLDNKPPAAPATQADVLSDGSVQVSWDPQDMEDVWQWAVWAEQNGQWQFSTYPGTTRSVRIIPKSGDRVTTVNVAAVDRTGNANFSKPLNTDRRTNR
jgi:uncharacterized lipoprotein YddW (UPF0748 family)